MSEGGFLPPQAPGGEPPPRFDREQPRPEAQQPPQEQPKPQQPETQPQPETYGGFEPPAGQTPFQGAPPQNVPPHVTGMPRDEGNGVGITAFALGIGGLVMFVIGGFGLFFILNLPLSIAAWVLGPRGVRKVDEGKTAQHRGLAQAGKIMGIIGVIIGVLALVMWALLIAFSDEVRDELDQIIDDATEESRQPDNDGLNLDTIVVVRVLATALRLVAG